jgi:dTDP-4-dehydrorhamnose 3,5-epimerase-like enzyme
VDISSISPAFEDERGSIWDLLTDENIHHIGMLKTKKNSIRGRHFHKKQKQYTLVLKGKIQVCVKDLGQKSSEIEKFMLNEMEMVLFPPLMYHSLEAIEDSICLIFTSKSRSIQSYEEDTFRVSKIKTFSLD